MRPIPASQKLLKDRIGIAQEGFHIRPHLLFQLVATDGFGLATAPCHIDRGRVCAIATIVEFPLPVGAGGSDADVGEAAQAALDQAPQQVLVPGAALAE